MLELLNHHLKNRSVIIITGEICTGKTWLIENYITEHPISLKRQLMTGLPVELSDEMLEAVVNSEDDVIELDEAQLLEAGRVLELVEQGQSIQKSVVVCCQGFNDNLDIKLANIAVNHGREALFIEMLDWDKYLNRPSEFDVSTRSSSNMVVNVDFRQPERDLAKEE